jgi:hypothetical protein
VQAGVCAFVASCKNGSGELIESLKLALGNTELKKGSNLQTVLANVINLNHTTENVDTTLIKPQLISTLPELVDFPDLKSPYKKHDEMALFSKAFLLSGKVLVLNTNLSEDD